MLHSWSMLALPLDLTLDLTARNSKRNLCVRYGFILRNYGKIHHAING